MPRIVYVSWPATEISGGIKAAFQHVEILTEAGLDAAIASRDSSAPGWFKTDAKILGLEQVGAEDILVFPENSAELFKAFAGSRNPKLVFCQSPLLAWQGLGTLPSCADAGISHIMCPSHTVLHYCRRRFPGVKLGYTPFYVDHSRFICAPGKTLQIACVPRKRPNEFRAIADLFRAVYPQNRSLSWVYLHQASEEQVAQVMGYRREEAARRLLEFWRAVLPELARP